MGTVPVGVSENGLSNVEYFNKVRKAIEQKYKVKPTSAKGDGPLQELTYAVGSLEISFGPDVRGGFYLRAVNTALREAW